MRVLVTGSKGQVVTALAEAGPARGFEIVARGRPELDLAAPGSIAGALARSKPDLARQGLRIAVDAMSVLRCDSGWAQWYDPTHKRNNGVAWTRGLGWAVLGLGIAASLNAPMPSTPFGVFRM